jgi:predicted nucleic-acid-binding protein
LIGLDTNIVLRFLLNDDIKQAGPVRKLFQSLTTNRPGWISATTVVEIEWVLTGKSMNREAVAQLLSILLSMDALIVDQHAAVAEAVQQFRSGRADFADCLIAASGRAAGCAEVFTFDRVAARDAGMKLLTETV